MARVEEVVRARFVVPATEYEPVIPNRKGRAAQPRPRRTDVVGSDTRSRDVLTPVSCEPRRSARGHLDDEASTARIELKADELDSIGCDAPKVRQRAFEP